MKVVRTLRSVGEVAFETYADTAKGQLIPRYLFRMTQANLKALFACGKLRVSHAAAIEQMDLVDMGDVDHGERRINQYSCARFLVGFSNCCLRGRFAVLHEAGGKRPEPASWLDGAPAQQDSILPFSDATDHQAGIFIVNVSARIADVSR